jgi:hypothetical protein
MLLKTNLYKEKGLEVFHSYSGGNFHPKQVTFFFLEKKGHSLMASLG